MKVLLTVSQLAKRLGVHPQTIRRWDRAGKLSPYCRTIGNHRRYLVPKTKGDLTIGYCRVSSKDQEFDLDRQVIRLKELSDNNSITITRIIKDIGSGMNYNKKGFKELLNLIITGQVNHLVILHKDRLLRFGSEIIFKLCSAMDVKVTILEIKEQTSMERFCQDLVEIMTVFCSKIYGQRSHKNKQKINNAQL